MENRIAEWRAIRDKYRKYSNDWYAHNKGIASLVRTWRKTNTLKLVK